MNDSLKVLQGKTIALCLTGGIAAYKAVAVARLLVQAGAIVFPIMTKSATRFVGKATLSGICNTRVLDSMWSDSHTGEIHIALADQVDAIVIVPCTANTLARLAQGLADDLVCALVLAAKTPIVMAPAMHPQMWQHPATQRNVQRLKEDPHITWVGPVVGPVASGDIGLGRMSEPEDIVAAIACALRPMPQDLVNKHIVVTAGPTYEDLDPVRFLGNRSSGKMGFSVAEVATQRGARVTLIAGPSTLPTPANVHRVNVRSALEMQQVLNEVLGANLEQADALVMAAAVADYRAAVYSEQKTKKASSSDQTTLELIRNPDILASIGARRGEQRHPVLVGFAVETTQLTEYARYKRIQKQVDLMVANLAKHGFEGEDNQVVFIDHHHEYEMQASKIEIAHAICNELTQRLTKDCD